MHVRGLKERERTKNKLYSAYIYIYKQELVIDIDNTVFTFPHPISEHPL